MNASEITAQGYYWCTHDLAMWPPAGKVYPREWHIVHVTDSKVEHAGADQTTPRAEVPDYVGFFGPLRAPEDRWLPIDTAPTDGTVVLLYQPGEDDHQRVSAATMNLYGEWSLCDYDPGYGDTTQREVVATHWMPRPLPPQ